MSHETWGDAEVYARLEAIDRAVVLAIQQEGCGHCGGRLHRADYPRKPRGVPLEAEGFLEKRFSLCCSREGCRRRRACPSVRFLGPKVYAAMAIVGACLVDAAAQVEREARRRQGRWLSWWRGSFPESRAFQRLRGWLGDLAPSSLPGGLWARVTGPARQARFLALVSDIPLRLVHEI